MAHLPTIRELQPLRKPAGRRAGPTAWYQNPDLIAVAIFSAIGFLVSLNVMLRFPDFAAALAQFAILP